MMDRQLLGSASGFVQAYPRVVARTMVLLLDVCTVYAVPLHVTDLCHVRTPTTDARRYAFLDSSQ